MFRCKKKQKEVIIILSEGKFQEITGLHLSITETGSFHGSMTKLDKGCLCRNIYRQNTLTIISKLNKFIEKFNAKKSGLILLQYKLSSF
jgi:hypothetical protein